MFCTQQGAVVASKAIQAMGLWFCCFKPQVAAPAVIKPLFEYEEKGFILMKFIPPRCVYQEVEEGKLLRLWWFCKLLSFRKEGGSAFAFLGAFHSHINWKEQSRNDCLCCSFWEQREDFIITQNHTSTNFTLLAPDRKPTLTYTWTISNGRNGFCKQKYCKSEPCCQVGKPCLLDF